MKRFISHPATFLAIALLVQITIAILGATSDKNPMGDVNFAYQPWIDAMFAGGKWFGINTPWVYPYPALAPLLLVKAIAPNSFLTGWLILAIGLNEVALAWLLWRHRAPIALGWFWLAATIALGPVALSRLDGLSVALVLIALAYLFRADFKNTSIWLTVATWLKVWPAAMLASLLVPAESRIRVFRAALYSSVIFVIIGFLLGGNQSLFSFILAQGSRGIQVESLVAMPWMWAEVQRHGAHIYFDTHILSFQIRGSGTYQTAHSMGWYMLCALAVTLALAIWANSREVDKAELISYLSLALTLELILFNKVGSPQYLGWLIIPVLVGLGYRVSSWWPAVIGVLAATALTQVIYPNVYDALVAAEYWPVVLLTARNLIELLIFIWAFWRLARLALKKKS